METDSLRSRRPVCRASFRCPTSSACRGLRLRVDKLMTERRHPQAAERALINGSAPSLLLLPYFGKTQRKIPPYRCALNPSFPNGQGSTATRMQFGAVALRSRQWPLHVIPNLSEVFLDRGMSSNAVAFGLSGLALRLIQSEPP